MKEKFVAVVVLVMMFLIIKVYADLTKTMGNVMISLATVIERQEQMGKSVRDHEERLRTLEIKKNK